MARQRHLSVVRTEEEDRAAKTQALRQIGERVPSQMRRVYDWHSKAADDLFTAMNYYVADQTLTPQEIEDMLDMPDLTHAYLGWLGRQ